MTKAEEAVVHLLRQMQRDGRLAYLIGWGTESFRLLTEAEAERVGAETKDLAGRIADNCRPVRIVESAQ